MVQFLNKELEIPKNVKSELVSKVRELIEYYDHEMVEIGKDFAVCSGLESNFTKCLETFQRIGVKSGDAF